VRLFYHGRVTIFLLRYMRLSYLGRGNIVFSIAVNLVASGWVLFLLATLQQEDD